MTLEELNASFIACLAKKTTYDPVKRQPKRPRRDNSYQHILYPIQQLAALTAVLRTVDDDACKYSVRYLVTTEGKLLFAQEGLPGFSIPKHRQIREKCLAAGNVYFSDDYKSITKINHCSGDFHPSADSLIWPIAALYLLKAPIAVPFTVETSSVNPQGVFTVEASYSLELKQIDDLLTAEMKTHILSANANSITVVIDYKDPSASIFIREPSAKRLSLFFHSLPEKSIDPAQVSQGARALF